MNPKFTIELQADKISNKSICFQCPLCKKSVHSKKPKIHEYPSLNNKENRIERHIGLCKDYEVVFIIYITDKTKRI